LGRKELIQKILRLPNKEHVLELGSGTSWLLQRCLEQDAKTHYTGVDLSEDMVALSRKKLVMFGNMSLRCESILDHNPIHKYDLIYASYSLSMMTSIYDSLFIKLRDILAENGRIFIVDFYKSPSTLFKKWMGFNHVNFLSNHIKRLQLHFHISEIQRTKVYFGLWEYALIELKAKKL
jgi:cyclopropane fatty-acyl-phospholipid synthase-like methyltransferase